MIPKLGTFIFSFSPISIFPAQNMGTSKTSTRASLIFSSELSSSYMASFAVIFQKELTSHVLNSTLFSVYKFSLICAVLKFIDTPLLVVRFPESTEIELSESDSLHYE